MKKAPQPTSSDWMLIRLLVVMGKNAVKALDDVDVMRSVQYLREKFGVDELAELTQRVKVDRQTEVNVVDFFV